MRNTEFVKDIIIATRQGRLYWKDGKQENHYFVSEGSYTMTLDVDKLVVSTTEILYTYQGSLVNDLKEAIELKFNSKSDLLSHLHSIFLRDRGRAENARLASNT